MPLNFKSVDSLAEARELLSRSNPRHAEVKMNECVNAMIDALEGEVPPVMYRDLVDGKMVGWTWHDLHNNPDFDLFRPAVEAIELRPNHGGMGSFVRYYNTAAAAVNFPLKAKLQGNTSGKMTGDVIFRLKRLTDDNGDNGDNE